MCGSSALRPAGDPIRVLSSDIYGQSQNTYVHIPQRIIHLLSMLMLHLIGQSVQLENVHTPFADF